MAVVMGEIRKSIVLAPSSLVLNQDGSCGMGLNVSAAGTYKRVSSTPPKVRRIDPLVRAQIEIKLMTCGRFSPP